MNMWRKSQKIGKQRLKQEKYNGKEYNQKYQC